MRRIFIYWIAFLIMLVAGITLVISSKSLLRREERENERLKKSAILRPSRIPKMPTAGEKDEIEAALPPKEIKEIKEAAKETPAADSEQPVAVLPSSDDLPPLGDIPVQINTDSLEVDIPAAQSDNPLQESQPAGQ